MTGEVRRIDWIDSEGGTTWTPTSEIAGKRPTHCVSVGFVISESDDHVTLVQSLDEKNDRVDGFIAIPTFAIIKSTLLRKGR